jgi:membrane protease YdiL (CAAX protease family)
MVEFQNTLTIGIAVGIGCVVVLASAFFWFRAPDYRHTRGAIMPQTRISWLDFSLTVWAFLFLFLALSMIAQEWLLPEETVSHIHEHEDVTWPVILFGFVIQITFVVILMGIKVSFSMDYLPEASERKRWMESALRGLETLVRYFPLLWLISFLWIGLLELLGDDLSTQEAVNLLFEIQDPLKLSAVLLVSAVGAPLLEELFFRGFILRVLMEKIPFWTANIGTSLLFAALHFNLPSLVPIFVLSLIMGHLLRRTGDVRCSVFMHMGFNVYSILFILLDRFA